MMFCRPPEVFEMLDFSSIKCCMAGVKTIQFSSQHFNLRILLLNPVLGEHPFFVKGQIYCYFTRRHQSQNLHGDGKMARPILKNVCHLMTHFINHVTIWDSQIFRRNKNKPSPMGIKSENSSDKISAAKLQQQISSSTNFWQNFSANFLRQI